MNDNWQKLKNKATKFPTPAWMKAILRLAGSQENQPDEIDPPEIEQHGDPFEDNHEKWRQFLVEHGVPREKADKARSKYRYPEP